MLDQLIVMVLGDRTYQILAHELARAMESALDARDLHTELLGHLRDREFGKIAQQNHFQVMGWEGFERTDQIKVQTFVGSSRELRIGQVFDGHTLAEHPSRQALTFAAHDREEPP